MPKSPKNILYKLALFIAVISILPFVIFIARREAPPEKIEVEIHKKQVIREFVLESKGKRAWKLISPEATFEGEKRIMLKSSTLHIYGQETVVLKSPNAIYDQKSGELKVGKVTIKSKSFYAKSDPGIYLTSTGIFTTEGSCYINIRNNGQIWGKQCILDLRKRKFIIKSNVHSRFRGVRR